MHDIPKAASYGVVLFNPQGGVMLREPSGHFGGYVWTFAKARPLPGETPQQTAIRAGLEDTGYHVELLEAVPEVFAGTTASSAFYVAGPTGRQGRTSEETSRTRWVSMSDAEEKIAQTKSAKGRTRDLAILRAAKAQFDTLPWERRPATCKEAWAAEAMPERRTEIALNLFYNHAAMAKIRKGFMPMVMEEKWFLWFETPCLYFQRSWSGICVYEVRFEEESDGWRAVAAVLNRDARQYTGTDDAIDAREIEMLIHNLLVNGPTSHSVDPFAMAFAQLSQPNYLGSPQVVAGLIKQVIEAAVGYSKGEQNFNACWDMMFNMADDVAEGNGYTLLPSWNTPPEQGQALIKYMGVREEEYFSKSLTYHLSEAYMKIFLKALELIHGFLQDTAAEWDPHALLHLNRLQDWAVDVMLGTNELEYPRVTLSDFRWQPVSTKAIRKL